MVTALWGSVLPQTAIEPKSLSLSLPVQKRCCPWLLGHTVSWLCSNYTILYHECHLYAKWAILSRHYGPIGVNPTDLRVLAPAGALCVSLFVCVCVCVCVRVCAHCPPHKIQLLQSIHAGHCHRKQTKATESKAKETVPYLILLNSL